MLSAVPPDETESMSVLLSEIPLLVCPDPII
jgi:hypothetical protein